MREKADATINAEDTLLAAVLEAVEILKKEAIYADIEHASP